jgi:DNA invertase Pin-like site-specific DNA recombinase
MVIQQLKYVTYYRVSTSKQGESGLGLKAQERDINLYFDSYSTGNFNVIDSFTDIESGADSNRKFLKQAIELCHRTGATLIVAKLDRLSRKVSFVAKLLEDKRLEFKVACMPNADKFQLHIYAALAEQERDFISKRTKAALQVAKANGVKLGGLRDKTNQRNKVIQKEANQRAEQLADIIIPMRNSSMTLQSIANKLNDLEYSTARGGKFTAMQVKRTIDRLDDVG